MPDLLAVLSDYVFRVRDKRNHDNKLFVFGPTGQRVADPEELFNILKSDSEIFNKICVDAELEKMDESEVKILMHKQFLSVPCADDSEDSEEERPKGKMINPGESKKKSGDVNSKKDQNVFSCQLCKKVFTRKNNLTTHFLTKHDHDVSTRCNVCGKTYMTIEALKDHNIIFCKLQCDKCTKTFTRKTDLEKHHTTCNKVELLSWQCDLCNKDFSKKIDVIRHVKGRRNPDGSYKFCCLNCGKRFCTLEEARQHHEDAYPKGWPGVPPKVECVKKELDLPDCSCSWGRYCSSPRRKFFSKDVKDDGYRKFEIIQARNEYLRECEKCLTKFSKKSDLKKHKEAAVNLDGSSKHVCDECEGEEPFCTGKQLKNHYNLKHREFKCLDCREVFSTKQHLMTHQRRKVEFLCSVCGKKFCYKKQFAKHMSRDHHKYFEYQW